MLQYSIIKSLPLAIVINIYQMYKIENIDEALVNESQCNFIIHS